MRALSTFLHYSGGVKKYVPAYGQRRFPLRFSPSAGGVPSVEVYLVLNWIEGFEPGLYHYLAPLHTLEKLKTGDLRPLLVAGCIQDFVQHAAAVCILTCEPGRVSWKYGARSYRYIHADCGIMLQNMYLVGTALGLNTCAIAGFYEDKIQQLLGLEDSKEIMALLFTLGYPPENQPVSSQY